MPVDDCAVPCFMGIQPGVTTTREALAILQTHDWVGEFTLGTSFGINNSLETVSGQVQWTWSGQQPARIIPNQLGQISVGNGLVHSVSIPVQFTIGDIFLMLGPPDASGMTGYTSRPPRLQSAHITYAQKSLAFSTLWECVPVTIWKPRHTRMPARSTIIFTNDPATTSNINYNLHSILFPCV